MKLSFNSMTLQDRRYTKPNLRLVNKTSLDRVLRAEIYVNEANGQLRATHLILGYTSLSFAFQAPKYVIRARDPRLQRISVAFVVFSKVYPFLKIPPTLNLFLLPLSQQEPLHPNLPSGKRK